MFFPKNSFFKLSHTVVIPVTSLNGPVFPTENETKERLDEFVQTMIKIYEEANLILEHSPKASATLLRRCLQGMIHDFWNVEGKNLNAEISQLKGKVTELQWKAIDGLRKIGNIGAHMEKDVDLIIDIEPDEALKLLKLIEMLIEKWYIVRHDEEILLNEIVGLAKDKENLRK